MRPQLAKELIAVLEPVKLRDIVEGGRARRKQVRLRVFDHLNAMLDRPQQPVGLAKLASHGFGKPSGRTQRLDRLERWRNPHGRIAPAMDHLLDLDEEFDLADAATAPLEVKAGADLGSLGEMVAD